MAGMNSKSKPVLQRVKPAPKLEAADAGAFIATVGPWRSVGACVASPAHVAAGKDCEDEIAFLQGNGILACALADGAGSRKQSKIGARISVGETCAELVEHFDDLKRRPRAEALVHRINLKLARQAAELGIEMRELASTLAFVAVRGAEYIAGNLGDGIVGCVQNAKGSILIAPEWGEYANQTFFMTDPSAATRTRIVSGQIEGDPCSFILMSDGAVKKLYDFKSKAMAPNGLEIASWLMKSETDEVLTALRSFMRDKLAPRAQDDCSIILVSRVGPVGDRRPVPSAAPASKLAFRRPDGPVKLELKDPFKAKPKRKPTAAVKARPVKRGSGRKPEAQRPTRPAPLLRRTRAPARAPQQPWRTIFATWRQRFWPSIR